MIRVTQCGQPVSGEVISSHEEVRRACYLQATHRDIHRSQLLKAPRRDTCCEEGRGGYICNFFNIAMNYNTVLNQFFYDNNEWHDIKFLFLFFYNHLISCQEVRN